MKNRRIAITVVAAALLSATAHSQTEKSAANSSPGAAKPFLGRWDLTLKAPDREYPSCLELLEEYGQLKAEMVGRWVFFFTDPTTTEIYTLSLHDALPITASSRR